jgi:hypothetical protein
MDDPALSLRVYNLIEKSHRRIAGAGVSIELVMNLVLFLSSEDEQPRVRVTSKTRNGCSTFRRKSSASSEFWTGASEVRESNSDPRLTD